jgi:glycosyltransferase involved in cell wall biosynthesis
MHCLYDAPIVLCPGQALQRDLIAAGVAPEKTVFFNNGFDPAVFFVPTAPVAHESHEIHESVSDAGAGTEDLLPEPAGVCAVRNAQAFADSASAGRGPGSGTLPGGVAGAAPLPAPVSVLFVGNLLPVKGVDRLLHAWQRALPHLPAGARLLLVGDGPLRQPLQQLAGQLGIVDTVAFMGRQPQTEIGAMMRQGQLLVLPSRSEGMPNVVVEAFACGLPVVATDVGEVPFLVRTGENGVVIPNGTDSTCLDSHAAVPVIEPLADAIVAALTAHWDAARIAQTVAGFSWDTAAAAVVNAFRGMKAEIGENRGSCPRNTRNQPIMHIRG